MDKVELEELLVDNELLLLEDDENDDDELLVDEVELSDDDEEELDEFDLNFLFFELIHNISYSTSNY